MSIENVKLAMLFERLLAITARKNPIASNDSERLLHIRILLLEYTEKN